MSAPPWLTVVALTLAALLLLVEAALPTFGVAGVSGLTVATLTVDFLARQGGQWWPLVLMVPALALWAVLLLRSGERSRARLGPAVATGLYAAGAVGYGLAAGSPAAVALGVLATAGMAAGFRTLRRRARRLAARPPLVGMDALCGRTARVVRWSGEGGTVRLDGALWHALGLGRAGEPEPQAGDRVLVAGYDRMVLWVMPEPVPLLPDRPSDPHRVA